MERAALLILFLAVTVLACSGGRPPRPSISTADTASPAAPPAASRAAPPDTPPAAQPAAQPAAPPCGDFKVITLSDPAQKQIRCGNGESFVVRRGDDGLWHEEMKVRAGTRPGYATPDEAGRARCCAPASR